MAEQPGHDQNDNGVPPAAGDQRYRVRLAPPVPPERFFRRSRYRRAVRNYAEMVWTMRTVEALEQSEQTDNFVVPQNLMIGKLFSGSSVDDSITPHEKLLDMWRILVTLALIAVLLVVIMFVVRYATKETAASVTPYVSLISGLAGIALGWMFASAGGGARKGESRQNKDPRDPTK